MGARIGAAILFSALVTPALAAGVLPFVGAFGDDGGCAFYTDGVAPEGDGYFLLTPDSFASYGTRCDFESGAAIDAATLTVKAVCSAEGEQGGGPDHLLVIGHGAAGYGVKFDGLDEWGPWPACPSVAILPPASEVAL
jgi:hypothetical protein